ncbi:MAG TPA: hypothetical protein VH253_07725 [Phycisphaerae bacterium]|nr:hypothetical protein [Phycisphaerae bacterium]
MLFQRRPPSRAPSHAHAPWAQQFGDEVMIDHVPLAWAEELLNHLLAAGFDGRRGGPIGTERPPGAGEVVLHVHNASVRVVRRALDAFLRFRKDKPR